MKFEKYESKLKTLVDALKFYAEPTKYQEDRYFDGKSWIVHKPDIIKDEGKKALAALSEVGVEIGNAKSGAV